MRLAWTDSRLEYKAILVTSIVRFAKPLGIQGLPNDRFAHLWKAKSERHVVAIPYRLEIPHSCVLDCNIYFLNSVFGFLSRLTCKKVIFSCHLCALKSGR